MTCPYCDSENVEVPMVDIGVGETQCGAAFCYECMAFQLLQDDQETEEEKKTGWRRGDEPK
jgi:hypothetical protein